MFGILTMFWQKETTIKTVETTIDVNMGNETTSMYNNYIRDIAKKHYHGIPIMFTDSDNKSFRDRVVQYGNNNKSAIKHMLSTIGYQCYMTCTNYDAVDEVLCIIAGEPYFEYLANERDDEKIIEVNYYLHLLHNPVLAKRQFIYGIYYNITFNALNHSMEITDSNRYKITLQKSYLTKHGYTKLYFEAR